jgi:adenine C2-methylase RlmN of 23S rRNA A2503 and tRNA A37
MGMGQPFLNFDAVLASAWRLPDFGITHRRTTISTVGWIPGFQRFVDEVEEPIRLALSLHAADSAKRSHLMPVNDRYPLADVLAECRRYFELRRLKVFVEYVLLAGVNDGDRPAHARTRHRSGVRPAGGFKGKMDGLERRRDRVDGFSLHRQRRSRAPCRSASSARR